MMRARERGFFILGVTILTGIVFTVTSLAILTIAINRTNVSDVDERRARAVYAAEAGLVWASRKLMVDPTFCFPDNPDLVLDADATPGPETGVDIVASSCGATDSRSLEAKVVY